MEPPQAVAGSRAGRRAAAAGVAGLVAVAAALRAAELGPRALWNDDAWVALISRHDWRDLWFTSLTSVGFRALIGAWIALAGDAPIAAQIPPFALGLAVVPAAYWVARRLAMHRLAALFAAALVTTSPLLATYSTRVKQYTGDALLTLAIAAAVTALVARPARGPRWWLFAGVSTVAVVFSGQLVLVVAPAVAVVVAGTWRARRDWPPGALPALGVLVAFAGAWHLAVVAPAVSPSVARFWAARYVALTLEEADGSGAQSLPLGLYRLLAGAVGGGAVHVAGAAALVGVALLRRRAVAVGLLAPVAGAVAAAAAGWAPIGGRPDTYLVPLIALAMAAGLDAVLRRDLSRVPPRVQRAGAAAALVLCGAVLLVDAPARAVPAAYPRQDVRSLARTWEARRAPGDHTFVHSGAGPAFALYSHAALVTRRAGRRLPHATVDDPAISVLSWRLRRAPDAYAGAVRAALDGRAAARVWLVVANARREDVPALEEAITARGYEREARWTTDGAAELTLYRKR